jgi:hypothetical protein
LENLRVWLPCTVVRFMHCKRLENKG